MYVFRGIIFWRITKAVWSKWVWHIIFSFIHNTTGKLTQHTENTSTRDDIFTHSIFLWCCYDTNNASYYQTAHNQRTYMLHIISATDTLQSTAYIINGHYVQLYMYNQCFLQSIFKRCNFNYLIY
jgi:hypothetical protein